MTILNVYPLSGSSFRRCQLLEVANGCLSDTRRNVSPQRYVTKPKLTSSINYQAMTSRRSVAWLAPSPTTPQPENIEDASTQTLTPVAQHAQTGFSHKRISFSIALDTSPSIRQ
ncbi:hypothetical protein AX14_009670 [Amanita brunnescens Koide BX004]|nr:hypothetical protein AX14_009670 [Amanita brunnescens Koide BX004]